LREYRVVIIVVNNNNIIIVYSLYERRLVALVVCMSVETIRGLIAGEQLFSYSGVILGLVPLEWGGLMFFFLVDTCVSFKGMIVSGYCSHNINFKT
jgi:hypothetical protein